MTIMIFFKDGCVKTYSSNETVTTEIMNNKFTVYQDDYHISVELSKCNNILVDGREVYYNE